MDDITRSPAGVNLLPGTLVAIACAMASPAPLAQTVSFTAGSAGVITEPTIPKVIDQATGRNRVFVNLLRTFERPGEVRPDIVIVPGVNSVLPWTYAPVRLIRPSGAGTLSDVTRQYFGNGALPGTGSAPDIVLGDFNRDGKLDFFIAESGWDNFQLPGGPMPGDGLNMILESAANGLYVDRSSTLPADTGNASVTTADVDGDGMLDVLVVPTPRLLKGKADGTFDRVTSNLPDWVADFSKVQERYSAARFVDVDNDGFPDLVLGRSRAGNNQARSLVLPNDGRGDFSHRAPVILPAGAFGSNGDVRTMAAIDANGDGYPDLLVLSDDLGGANFQVQLLVNRGDGTFVDETLARLGPRATVAGYGWDGVAVVDLNGDGKPDFVLQTNYGGAKGPTDFAWINDGNGVFAPVALSTLPGKNVFRIVSADVNGDGVPDVVAFSYDVEGNIAYQTFLNAAVRTVPSEPVIGAAVAGDAQATVSFSAPLHAGASAVTGYATTCHGGPDGGRVTASGTGSPITVTGLVNGVAYACSVTATNARGTSMPSARSNLVTPRGSLAVAVTGNGTSLFRSPVTFTATLSGATSATGTVTFRSFGAPIPGCGTRPVVSNMATCATSALAYGPHLVSAFYSGDASNKTTVSPAVAHMIIGGLVVIDNFTAPTIAAGTTTIFYTAIKNVGTAPLDLGEITFTGPFTLSLNTCGTTLVPGQSCTVNIAYAPTTATPGGVLGTMRVAHSGANSPYVANLSGIVLSAAGGPNVAGLWWNPLESGWGINFAHQGDVVFATWFTYDANGRAWWLSMTAPRAADGTYAGALIQTDGPSFSSVPFDPARVTRTTVGAGTLRFTDGNNGTFAYTVNGVPQTKAVARQVFGPLPTCAFGQQPNFTQATNYQDLWWMAAGSESGWGLNLTHQGDNIFGTWFTYDVDGKPLWLSVTAAKSGPGVYGGQLIRTGGPAFNAVPFTPAAVTRTVVGTATLTFANGNAATFTYTVNGVTQSKAISRQLFASPAGTLCQ